MISWAAHDWSGRPWADEWQPITFLKRSKPDAGEGLYEKARAMELAKSTQWVAAWRRRGRLRVGVRCSPRLAETQEERN